MIVDGAPSLHLTYCTNIHPARPGTRCSPTSRHVLAVKARCRPTAPSAWACASRPPPPAPGRARRRWRPSATSCRARPLRLHHQRLPLRRLPRHRGQGERLPPDWLEDERVAYSDRSPSCWPRWCRPASRARSAPCPAASAERADGDARRRMAAHLRRHAPPVAPARAHRPHHRPGARARAPLRARDQRRRRRLLRAPPPLARRRVAAFAPSRPRPGPPRRPCAATSASASTPATPPSSSRSPPRPCAASERAGLRILKVQVSAGLRGAPHARFAGGAGPFAEGSTCTRW
jgi:hypothetical protein